MPLNEHTRTNRRQAVLLIAGLVVIVGVCGLLIAGAWGLMLALLGVAIVVGSTTRQATSVVMRMYKAQQLNASNAPELLQLFTALVQRAELKQLPRLYYVPSKTLNAFAIGHGDEASVALTAGLIQRLNPRELAGVIAHELSHIQHNDLFVMSLADGLSRIATALGQVGQILLVLSVPAFLLGYDVPLLGAVVLFLAPGISALLQLALSRSREYNADVGAVRITGDPLGLASALARLETVHTNWLERVMLPGRRETQPALLRTHPHTSDRIERLNAIAGNAPATTLPTPDVYTTRVQHAPLRAPRWHMLGLWY